jgi:hypothetical protein
VRVGEKLLDDDPLRGSYLKSSVVRRQSFSETRQKHGKLKSCHTRSTRRRPIQKVERQNYFRERRYMFHPSITSSSLFICSAKFVTRKSFSCVAAWLCCARNGKENGKRTRQFAVFSRKKLSENEFFTCNVA